MRVILIATLVSLSVVFLSLSDSKSQKTTAQPAPMKMYRKAPPVDSIIIYYSRIIDSNHLYTESRIRSFVNKVLDRTTDTDTLTTRIIIR